MVVINLLPVELAPRQTTRKVAKVLKQIAIVGYVLLFASIIAVVALVYLLSKQKNEIGQKESTLSVSIKALEETEQKLILTQDRLRKISIIFDKESAKEELLLHKKIEESLPEGIILTSFVVKQRDEKMSVSFSLNGPNDLEALTDILESLEEVRQVELNVFNYSPSNGYTAAFSLKL